MQTARAAFINKRAYIYIMQIKYNEIMLKFSYNDIKRELKIPKYLTKDLAEEIGIHLGDGSLGIYRNKFAIKNYLKYAYHIAGSYDDEQYFKKFLIPLMEKLYNIRSHFYKSKNEKSITLSYQSKGLLYFKGSLGMPLGKKLNIAIPKIISDSDLKLHFIRGLFDTDGCLTFLKRHRKIHYYPRIDICSNSSRLIKQVSRILEKNEFVLTTTYDEIRNAGNGTLCKTSRLFLNGQENLFRWMKKIGTSNPKNRNKFNIWQKYGYLPKTAPDGI